MSQKQVWLTDTQKRENFIYNYRNQTSFVSFSALNLKDHHRTSTDKTKSSLLLLLLYTYITPGGHGRRLNGLVQHSTSSTGLVALHGLRREVSGRRSTNETLVIVSSSYTNAGKCFCLIDHREVYHDRFSRVTHLLNGGDTWPLSCDIILSLFYWIISKSFIFEKKASWTRFSRLETTQVRNVVVSFTRVKGQHLLREWRRGRRRGRLQEIREDETCRTITGR